METAYNKEKAGKSWKEDCAIVPSLQVLSQAIHQLGKQDEAAKSYQDASLEHGQKPSSRCTSEIKRAFGTGAPGEVQSMLSAPI